MPILSLYARKTIYYLHAKHAALVQIGVQTMSPNVSSTTQSDVHYCPQRVHHEPNVLHNCHDLGVDAIMSIKSILFFVSVGEQVLQPPNCPAALENKVNAHK